MSANKRIFKALSVLVPTGVIGISSALAGVQPKLAAAFCSAERHSAHRTCLLDHKRGGLTQHTRGLSSMLYESVASYPLKAGSPPS